MAARTAGTAELGEAATAGPTAGNGFSLAVGGFDGPFDLLLSLLAKHELDITEIALSIVTNEFIRYVRALEDDEQLDRASEFLVVAATLLDMKVASLLPQGELVDAEDVAALEARDLLFARLLQYRAFKQVAAHLGSLLEVEGARHARQVRLEDKYRASMPELRWTTSLEDFAALALLAFTPKTIPVVGLDHLHAPLVSIREQAATIAAILGDGRPRTFRELIAGIEEKGVVVARFLAVLELYRRDAVGFEQIEPLGELTVTWTARGWSEESLANLGSDYDH